MTSTIAGVSIVLLLEKNLVRKTFTLTPPETNVVVILQETGEYQLTTAFNEIPEW
jgi:hypothetical protein